MYVVVDVRFPEPRVRDLALFAPFVAMEDLGDAVRVFDPLFPGRIGLLEPS